MKVASKISWPFLLLYVAMVEIFSSAKYGLAIKAKAFKSTMACDDNMVHLRCPHKSLVLNVYNARYGRLLSRRNICQSNDPDHVIKECGEDTVTSVIQERCMLKTECSFTVNGRNLGEYCTNVYKYLIVVYGCVTRPTPKTAMPTTTPKATTTPKPTTTITTTLMNVTTSSNFTTENSTPVSTTTFEPMEFGRKTRLFTRQPHRPVIIETYDKDVFRRNHGTPNLYVSGLQSAGNFGLLLLVLIFFDVYLVRVT